MGKFWIRIAEKLDKVTDLIVNAYANLREAISPGWKVKNASKIEEWKLMLRAFNRSPLAVIGALLVMFFIIVGIFGPLIAPHDYRELNYAYRLLPPGTEGYLFGTDDYGRDILSLILYGTRISLVISFTSVIIYVPIGIILGLISGYYGGKVDEIIMRIVDIFYAFPALILAMTFAAVLPDRISLFLYQHPELRTLFLGLFGIHETEAGNLAAMLSVIFAIALVGWPGYTRMVRALTLEVRENVFIEAAKGLGLSDWQIIRKHILPNISSVILVMVTIDLSSVIILEAALAFLGLGAQWPIPDLGRLVAEGGTWLTYGKWWFFFFPGLMLFVVGLGWNLLGDALRDIFDPKTRRAIEFGAKKEPIYAHDILDFIAKVMLLLSLFVIPLFLKASISLYIYLIILTMIWYIVYAIFNFGKLKKFFVGDILSIITAFALATISFNIISQVPALITLASFIFYIIAGRIKFFREQVMKV